MKKNLNFPIEQVNVSEISADLKEMKKNWQELIDEDPDYDGEADMVMGIIGNLMESLKGTKDISKLDLSKKARIYADMVALSQLMDMADEDMDDDDDDFNDFEFDDFDDENTEEEE